jgi:hypothetical protein
VTDRPEDDASMIRYLLGELDQDEQAELDQRAFVDDAWEERRDTAADELIDAYLAGTLRPEARQRFEIHFLASAAHRERFQLVRDLRSVLARKSPAPSASGPVRRTVVWSAAAAALLAALAALFALGRRQATDQLVAVATPPPIATPVAPVATPVPGETREPAAARTLNVAVADASRSVAVSLGPGVRTVRFAIPVVESGAPSYSVTVRQGDKAVWQSEDLVPREAGAPVEVGVPANLLAAGAVLSIEPEATRGASPAPPPVREWTLRVVRR